MKTLYLCFKDEKNFIGSVYVDFLRGKEVYSFEYSEFALKNNLTNLIIDPEILPSLGRQFKIESSQPYRFLSDLSPDRWGKNLIKRKNNDKTLNFSDYLVNVSDISREGAIRIKLNKEEKFALDDNDVPPLKNIKTLEKAAYFYDELSEDDTWKILLSPGSSLGGSRPKCSVFDGENELYIAKFTHKNDDYDVSKVEYLTYLLAKKCGIDISESKLIEIDEKRSIFLTKRFDRNGIERIHYASFMTILNVKEGKSDTSSYLEVAEAIKRVGCQTKKDLQQLFKRISFYLLVHNCDDHLRNIGMLFGKNGYYLAPCFDVNMTLFPSHLTLPIASSGENNLEHLESLHAYFDLTKEEAHLIVEEQKQIIKDNLEPLANQIHLESDLKQRIIKTLL